MRSVHFPLLVALIPFPAIGPSRLQIPFFEFLRGRAVRAELLHRRAGGREGKWLEGLLEHLVEVVLRGNANADMRIEVPAGHLRHKRRNVLVVGFDRSVLLPTLYFFTGAVE